MTHSDYLENITTMSEFESDVLWFSHKAKLQLLQTRPRSSQLDTMKSPRVHSEVERVSAQQMTVDKFKRKYRYGGISFLLRLSQCQIINDPLFLSSKGVPVIVTGLDIMATVKYKPWTIDHISEKVWGL